MRSRRSLYLWSLLPVLCIFCVALGLSCSDDEPTKPKDTTPPAAVLDLEAASSTASSITLTWTAVGDDSQSGTAARYDIRYTPDSLATWENMLVVSNPPAPKPTGEAESFVVTGLNPNTRYYFQMKVADEVPNWSGLSNRASAATGSEDPGTGRIVIAVEPDTLRAPWNLAGPAGFEETGDGDVTLEEMVVGEYTIAWGEVAGWSRPDPYEVTQALEDGGSIIFTGVYTQDDPGHGGEMIWIPAGYVRLGQEGIAEPVDDVWLDGFWIGKYPVTNGEYAAFIAAGGYTNEEYWNPVGWAWRVESNITLPRNWDSNEYHGGGIPGNEQFPVNGVSWWEADAYCRWAGKRLPTEAEWEKAAKGPSPNTPTYPWGEEISGQRANYWGSGDPYENNGWTTPVGFYDGSNHGGFQTIDSPSPYGLYDVAGNLWEWTSTGWEEYPYDANDGRENPPASAYECCRVLRGGSWDDATDYLRCARRSYRRGPSARSGNSGGFRCASN